MREYVEANRRAWNEIAGVRQAVMWPPADYFARGGSVLNREVLDAAGELRGDELLHLQCATGEETLSWAVAGARATGLDLSEAQVALAQRKAEDADLGVRFIAGDVLDPPAELQRASFDLVYVGLGSLVWLPDLERWAGVVAAALRPGGRLIVRDGHPLAGCLEVEDGMLRIAGDYFGRATPQYGRGWRHFEGGEDASETKVQFHWPLGDVVTALARGGMNIERLEEFPGEAGWRFGDLSSAARRLPGEYLLVATRA